MTTRLQQRRARLRAEYGFDFPDDFYRFWEFATRLSPLDPLHAVYDAMGIALVGPFEVLAGRFDGRVPKRSLLLHWRYYLDPPEFFTVLAGGDDGLHWGYVLDDPDRGHAGCVADYYARDAYEIATDGDSLFEAVRLQLEYSHADQVLDREYGLEDEGYHASSLASLTALRERMMEYATGNRSETGEEYTERYSGLSARNDLIVAETWGGLGVVAPPGSYRPLSAPDKRLWKAMFKKEFDAARLVEEARQALRDGYPTTAIKLGCDLWAAGEGRALEWGYELLDAGYAALGRETLRRVLQTHRAHRELPSVDILDDKGPAGG
jgi:hypothetical protein